jgi:RNA polymerase sigma-70 factor (ECF subfamily)
MNEFRAALSKLKDEQREALILVGALGFSYEEASETTGVAVGTVKSRINRARKQLAELLGLNEDEAMEMTDDATMSVLSASKVSSF